MKKVLSFVLVLAMILGSVSMAFAFTDDAAITNTEAAKVLNAAGILEGYTDGSFKADQVLTRAEGTAIVARMLLGKSDAAKLSTVVNPFNDVKATDWCAGYIAYCVSQGIIAGYGDGNFGPNDPLTVAAFGKMMLTALGYKADQEGFVGANWESNVGSMMVKAGLTDGVTTTNSAGCSRGVAAQVGLNTLKAILVEYPNGSTTTVQAGSATVTIGAGTAQNAKAQAGDKANYKNENPQAATDPVRFMNRYQKDLKLGATSTDAFGRPDTNKWTYKGESVYTAKSTSNLLATYTTKQDKKVIYTLLDNHDALKATTTYSQWEDGVEVATSTALKTYAASWKNSTDKIGSSGNGEQIEVFYDSSVGTDGAVKVVMYNYYLVKATADYNASQKKVKIEWTSTTGSITGLPNEIEQKDFNVENVKEDDYLVVTVAGKEIKSVAPATKVTGNINTYTKGSDITIDGTKYSKANKIADDKLSDVTVGADITLVLDPNNFVLTTTDETSANQYVYIYKVGNQANLDEDDKAIAFFTDGTRSTITVDGGLNTASAGAWYNYSVKSSGKYKLTNLSGGATQEKGASQNVSGKSITYWAGHTNANSTTVFLTVKPGEKKNAKVYTGYKAAPNATAATVAAVVKSSAAKFVFIESGTITGANSGDYVLFYAKKAVNAFDDIFTADGDYFKTGKTVKNGTFGDVEFSADNAALIATGTIYADIAYDSDGRVDNTAAFQLVAPGNAFGAFKVFNPTAASNIKVKDGVVTVNDGVETKSYGYDSSAVAWLIEGSDYSDSSLSNNYQNRLDGDQVVAIQFTNDTDKDTIKTIYFIKY